MIREKVKQTMKLQGVTIRHLALKVGCRTATISDFLNGKKNLTAGLLEKVFEELNLKIN